MNRRFQSVLRILAALLAFAKQAEGEVGNDNPTGSTGEYNGSITTAGSYDPYTGNAKRFVTDLTVTGSVGAYPLQWTRVVNSRNGQANAPLGQGGVWNHSYQWGAWVRPERVYHYYDNQYEGPGGEVTYPDGRKMVIDGWYSYPTGSGFGEPGDYLMAVGNGDYHLMMKDGGRVEFTHPSGIHLLATAVVDPYGQRTSLEYDSERRLSKITEPAGRYLQLNYSRYSYTIYFNHEPWSQVRNVDVISSVQAFDGRGNLVETVGYRYQMEQVGQNQYYNLQWVDYADGTHAYYEYFPSESYTHVSGRIKSCNDVRFDGPMKQIQYQYATVNDTPGPIAVGQIKAEKNLLGQIVSEVIYPAPSPHAGSFVRTERRGDGKTRILQYATDGSGELASYTDFKGKPSQIGFAYVSPITYRKDLTDARFHTTSLLKESGVGAVLRVTHPDINNSFIEYTYSDPSNAYHVASRRDERGHFTYYDRETGTNRIWRTRYPDGSSEEFTYNGFGQVETHKLRSGGTENFRYDSRGRKTLSWPPATGSDPNPAQHPTQYSYYETGLNTDRLRMVIDPRNNTTTYEYNQRGQVTKVQHHDGTFTQSHYYDDGTLAWTADENHPGAANDPSQRTRYEYDEYKRVRKVINPMGGLTETWYGLNPITWGDELLHTTTNPKYTISPMSKNVVYDYDDNLRKTGQNVALGTADFAHTGFEYDEVGNLITTTDPRWHVTTFGYDSRNRQIWMNNPVASNRNTSGHTMNWEYDYAGNKIKETRADDAFRSWEYDSVNRLKKTVDWRMSLAEPERATLYWRNVTSTEETITDAKGAVYTFGFDALHRKISATYPMDATSSVRTETWDYDPAGNIKLYKNPAGQYKHLDFSDSYDSRNRLRHSAWNIDPVNNTWNPAVGPETRTVYDPASRMTSITTNGGETTVSFAYDDANRLLWEDQTVVNGGTRRVQHDRDGDGNATNTHIPGWYLIWHGYNQRNQLAQIQDGGGTPWINFSYDAAGNVTKRQAVYGGVNDSLNVPTEYYDGLNRPTRWENTGAGDVAFGRSWQQYDSAGRMTATWRDEQGSKGDRFAYNVRNQVTNSAYEADQVWTGNPQNAQRTVSYEVDPLNRQSVSDSAEAKPNGLSATYYSNDNFTGSAVLRNDAVVNFAWNGAAPAPNMPGEGFSVRWEGQVVPRYSQTYTFYTQSDDGVRLWVNGQLLIDNWTYHGWTENSGTITLVAGRRYSIRMEYFQGTAGAVAALLWSSPSQGKEVIPSSQLYAARPANGLQATYYDNLDFTGTKVLRTDPAINFDWGGGSPEPTMGVDGFSVRWEGQIVPRYSETYTFYAGSDDGVRLWINGQLIVNNWWDRGHTEGTGTINLVLGQSYDIRMEYYENGGLASASLAWSSARQPKEIVPQSQLFVPSKSGNYSSNALNQYTRAGGQTLGYDGGFNLTSYAGATFTYNAQNQLITGTKGTNTVQFVYDGLGRCLKRTTNGASIIFAYDGWKPIAEWAGDGSYWGFRIYGAGPDEILWHYDSRSGYGRVHSDVHGSVYALLASNGSPLEKYSYDAFGKPKITDWAGNERGTSSAWNRFMYTGREWIAELGIYDYRRRMYHPELGRFLQGDPLGLQTEGDKLSAGQKALFSPGFQAPEAFSSSEMNLFRYCGDDPVDRSDPTGLEVQASLEYYILNGSMGRGHMNITLHDTTTGETYIGRGAPNERYEQSALRSLFDRPQKSETGNGNVKLKMDVNPGKKGIDPDTGNQTTTVPGSLTTLKDDMKTALAKLKQIAAQITDKKLDYRLQTVNSNSAAATAYNEVSGQVPPETPLLPHSNRNILTGRELRPAPYELSK
jgi:RHS repeat-associated protein